MSRKQIETIRGSYFENKYFLFYINKLIKTNISTHNKAFMYDRIFYSTNDFSM